MTLRITFQKSVSLFTQLMYKMDTLNIIYLLLPELLLNKGQDNREWPSLIHTEVGGSRSRLLLSHCMILM
jgi:hypothetical protein